MNSCCPSLIVFGDEQKGKIATINYQFSDECWQEYSAVIQDRVSTPALAFLNVFTVLIGSCDTTSCKTEYVLVQHPTPFCVSADGMYDLPALNKPRLHSACFLIGSCLWVCGGEDDLGSLREVEVCNLTDRELSWIRMPSMCFKRANHSVVFHDDFVYIIGGNTNRCEKFDPGQKQWHEIPPLPSIFHRFQPAALVVQERLIAMNSFMPTHIYELSETVGLWRCNRVVGCPPGRILGVTSWANQIYALDDRQTVSWFDIRKPTWKILTRISIGGFSPLHMSVADSYLKDEDE